MGRGGRIGQGRITPVKELGCEQVEVFQSVVYPDKLAILERCTDQAALDAHAEHSASVQPELRAGSSEYEDYT